MTLLLSEVKKTYAMGDQLIHALDHVSLRVENAEMLAIVGPSGSGKSTLMNMIGLLDRPDSGEYYLNGVAVHDANVDQRAALRNRYIGFIFQSFFLLPKLNVLQNVGLPLFYRGLNAKRVHDKVRQTLASLGMADYWQHKPSQLSGGQQQRVAIARALVGEPAIILADEPTGSLDSATSQDIMDLLISLNREREATIVIITHDQKIASQCGRIVTIRDGRLSETA